jgi:poly-beta-1,6-N-acetyl-D-glucosamine synthase
MLFLLAGLKKKAVEKQTIYPMVTLIIAAYNEENVIEEKIKNSFQLDYPKDKLEIIIVSDGSSDHTPEIVNGYKDRGIASLFHPERRGKTAALNRAVSESHGEVVVFSDANSMYDSNAIKLLVRNFNDPSVGGVCGRKSIIKTSDRESSRGDSLFWNCESAIKIRQSLIGSITTGDGEIFAIRRVLYSQIPENVINDDTAITFNIISKGHRVVYEPEAVSREEASIVLKDDFNVKARMVSGGYQMISMYANMLLPPKNFFALQFLSHKVPRYSMGLLLVGLFVSNLFLENYFYRLFLYLQLLFYFSASCGYFLRKLGLSFGLLYFPLYYCTMNIAASFGLYYFLKGKTGVSIWKKAKR